MVGHHGVAGLMEGGGAPLLFGQDHAFALHSHHHLILGFLDVLHRNFVFILPGGQERGLIDQVGQVSPHQPGGSASQDVQVYVFIQRHVLGVYFEDPFPTPPTRDINHDLTVEPAGPQQGLIQDVRAIGGRQQDHTGVVIEAIHFHQQLIQGLFTLVMPTAHAGAPGAPHGVDLINENN